MNLIYINLIHSSHNQRELQCSCSSLHLTAPQSQTESSYPLFFGLDGRRESVLRLRLHGLTDV